MPCKCNIYLVLQVTTLSAKKQKMITLTACPLFNGQAQGEIRIANVLE